MASWQADCHGGSRGGIRDRAAHVGPGRLGSDAGCQGRRDCRAATPADGVTPAGRTAALCTRGPVGVGRVGEASTAGALAGVSGHAGDAAALASRVGGPPLDISGRWARSAGFGPRGRRPGRADGAGEPSVGEGCNFSGTGCDQARHRAAGCVHGGAHTGLHGRPTGPRAGWPGPVSGGEGRGDRGAAPSARRAAPSGGPAPIPPYRPAHAGDVVPAAAAGPLAGLPGHTVDAVTLAPRVGAAPLDLSDDRPTRRSCPAARRGRTGAAAGPGEPPLGVSAHRRRVPQAGHRRLRDLGARDPSSPPPGSGTPTRRTELDAVPTRPGRRDARL